MNGFLLSRIRKHDRKVSFFSKWEFFVALGKVQDGIEYSDVRIEAAEEDEEDLELVKHVHASGFSRFAFIGLNLCFSARV